MALGKEEGAEAERGSIAGVVVENGEGCGWEFAMLPRDEGGGVDDLLGMEDGSLAEGLLWGSGATWSAGAPGNQSGSGFATGVAASRAGGAMSEGAAVLAIGCCGSGGGGGGGDVDSETISANADGCGWAAVCGCCSSVGGDTGALIGDVNGGSIMISGAEDAAGSGDSGIGAGAGGAMPSG